ncbi:MAG: glycosyltransferase family 2 protein, partial [Planctomycetota bacterium]|nr:glycosyltransferase family 2 protein [Planctomycetota bacterium]
MVTMAEKNGFGLPRFVVVSPTYNHGRLLAGVLEGLKALGLVVIVVDDGSMDETAAVLVAWQSEDPPRRQVMRLTSNGGKAAALLAGFARARELGFTHALTIDSDGQHDPKDLPRLMEQANHEPGALVIGMRPMRMQACPLGSTIGRVISNHFVWVASGVRVCDSQSGLRCYPLDVVEALGVLAGRYGFETEVVTRAGWAGVAVHEVPIQCTYEVPGGRVTHFRKVHDSSAAVKMHARLVGRSLLPGAPLPRIGAISDQVPTGTILQRAWRWLGPGHLVNMIRNEQGGRERIAASVGTGLVMATLPLYGIKTIACLWLAARFRLHPTVVIGVSSLST